MSLAIISVIMHTYTEQYFSLIMIAVFSHSRKTINYTILFQQISCAQIKTQLTP